MVLFTDAHCHLPDPRVTDLDQVLARSRAAGITRWVLGGVGPEDWDAQVRLRERMGPSVVLSFGLHPWRARELSEEALAQELALLKERLPQAHALGELGLDRMQEEGWERQVQAFEAQLALAQGKPLILHVVRAHEPVLERLEKGGPHRGLVHSFIGGPEVARRYLDLGLKLSLSGVVARAKGYEQLKRAVVKLPADAWTLESDTPDQSHTHGVPSEPADLLVIADAIAALRGSTREAVLIQAETNLTEALALPKLL